MRWTVVVALASFALLSGCLQGLQGVEKVTNQVDQFAYGGSFAGKSATKTFTWQTTGKVAAVNWGTANAEAGSVRVRVADSAGATVYDGTLRAGSPSVTLAEGVTGTGASTYSTAGQSGAWTIIIDLDGYSGLLGLSVQAKGHAYDTSASASDTPPS